MTSLERPFLLLLGVDVLSTIFGSYRYGDKFLCPQLDIIPNYLIINSVYKIISIKITIAFLCFIHALFYRSRITIILICALFNYVYFISMLDGYQHHYMIGAILFLMTERDESKQKKRIGQLMSIVYFYTALTKLTDSHYLSGDTLRMVMTSKKRNHEFVWIIQWITRMEENHIWSLLSIGSVLLEISYSIVIQIKPRNSIRRIFVILVYLFHIFIQLSGLHIRLFTFYMLLLNGYLVYKE
jgi:hypothetical protein